MADFIQLQIRQGLKADLPILAEGELGWCTDTQELFIGNAAGNVFVDSVYSPATPTNWAGTPPSTSKDALDRLAAVVVTLNEGPIA